jgi:predicted nucleic acid-binding protein
VILLDTNVLIYAFDPDSPLHAWARQTIAEAVSGDGGAIDVISLAEICVGDAEPNAVAERIRRWDVDILDLPVAAAEVCAAAYREYRLRRHAQSGLASPRLPLPDFFVGAHAVVMGWPLATADSRRFATYFPDLVLKTP